MSLISRRAFTASAAASLAAPAAFAADPYPNHFIRFVLPFSAGGGTDLLTRIIGQKLTDSMHQPIVADNRPGAAGNIATQAVAIAPKDGYTLLLGVDSELVVNPALYPHFDVNIQRDLAPIATVAEALFVLVVAPSLPIHSVADLVAYAKANPGKLNFTSAGVGSPTHLAAELFMQKTGARMTHLPYGGGTQAVTALLTGEGQVDFASLPTAVPNIKAGKLRALALTSLKPSPLLPNVPTLDQSGVSGYQYTERGNGLLAPAGTPKPVIDKLNREVLAALKMPDVQQSLAKIGLTAAPSSPAQLADRIKRETTLWAQIVKQANIKPQ